LSLILDNAPMGEVVGRTAELSAISRMLDLTSEQPAALVLEGEAGIGKTTLLRAGVELARERLFWVLWCSPAAAEVRLAYAGLADLMGAVGEESFDALSGPMGQALDAAQVLEFAVRRLSGRVGVLAAQRLSDGARVRELALAHSEPVERLPVGPLGNAALQRLVRARAGRALPRPVFERISVLAAGNPFFALEIAAAIPNAVEVADLELPESLLEVVRARISGLGPPVRRVLLAA